VTRSIALIIALLVPPAAAIALSKLHQSLRYPRRFAEVSSAGLYRGGMPSAEHLRHLHEDKGVRCVLNLTDEKPGPEEAARREAMRALGIQFRRIPMPGDGRADFVLLDAAADALADQRQWPMYFHCAAGKQRSSAVLAAYRLRHCGWTIEAALAELEARYDLDRTTEGELCDHLRAYAARSTPGIRPPSESN